jgi:hypothetical protein
MAALYIKIVLDDNNISIKDPINQFNLSTFLCIFHWQVSMYLHFEA